MSKYLSRNRRSCKNNFKKTFNKRRVNRIVQNKSKLAKIKEKLKKMMTMASLVSVMLYLG